MKKFVIVTIVLFTFLFLIFGAIVYKFVRNRATPKVSSNPKEVISSDKKIGICDSKLENESNNKVVEVFKGIPKRVDFTTMPEAKNYYTVITNAVASGSNFAGHFTLASWGCGTDCFGYAVVETKTGEVIAYSGANGSYHLGSFSLNSRIFVLDPVYAGQEKKYYKIIEGQDEKTHLDLVCTEVAEKDMYGLPE